MAKKKTTTTKNTKKKKVYDIVEYRGDSCYDKEYTWYSFFNEFSANNKTDIDENFQSPPRWIEQTKYRYLKSASKQFTRGSSIVVYDVEAGLSYCKRNYLQTDVEHLENWISREVKYLVIDGNNKRWTIIGYIGDNLKLNFNLKYTGQTYEVRNKTFSELKNPNMNLSKIIEDKIIKPKYKPIAFSINNNIGVINQYNGIVYYNSSE